MNETLYIQMKKTLRSFRYMEHRLVANLAGLKHIMRVTTPRKCEWWLVLPACGDSDAVCVLLKKVPRWELVANVEAALLAEFTNHQETP